MKIVIIINLLIKEIIVYANNEQCSGFHLTNTSNEHKAKEQ
jgi:hypothetical protein